MASHTARERIVIAGGGFSGSMTAFHLLNQSEQPLHITIVEPKKKLGLGLAYSTTCGEHLLNVSAAGMSALADDPKHFLHYAVKERGAVEPEEFLPRMFFGQYVSGLIEGAIEANKQSGLHVFERIEGTVDDAELQADGTFKVTITSDRASSSALKADHIVLALGNLAGKSPRWLDQLSIDSEQYLHDPWNKEAVQAIAKTAPILIIGTGLTAVDKIIELKTSGHTGKIIALSRHGLLPRRHLDKPDLAPVQTSLDAIEPKALATCKKIREIASKAEHWQSGIDTFRLVTKHWWGELDKPEKLRFMRHLQTYWDVHRHRMAPSIAAHIDAYQTRGELSVIAGSISSMQSKDGKVHVTVKMRRQSQTHEHVFERVINCTGPQSKLNAVESELLANLFRRKLIKPDITGAGLACSTKDYFVVNDKGEANSRLHAVGPMLKAELLESVAVPELKHQAKFTADRIIESCTARK